MLREIIYKTNEVQITRLGEFVNRFTGKVVTGDYGLLKEPVNKIKVMNELADSGYAMVNESINKLVKDAGGVGAYDLSLRGLEPAIKVANTAGGVIENETNLVNEIMENEEVGDKFVGNVVRDFKFVRENVLPNSVRMAESVEKSVEETLDGYEKKVGGEFDLRVVKHFDGLESYVVDGERVAHKDVKDIKSVSFSIKIDEVWDKLSLDVKYGDLFKMMAGYYKIGKEELELILDTYVKVIGGGYGDMRQLFKLENYDKLAMVLMFFRVYMDRDDLNQTTIYWQLTQALKVLISVYERNVESGTVIYKSKKSENGFEVIVLADVYDRFDKPLDVIFGAVILKERGESVELMLDSDQELLGKMAEVYREYQDKIMNKLMKGLRTNTIDIYVRTLVETIEKMKSSIEQVFGVELDTVYNMGAVSKEARAWLYNEREETLAEYQYVSSRLMGMGLRELNSEMILEGIRSNLKSNSVEDLNLGIAKAVYSYILQFIIRDYYYEKK